MTQVGTEPIPEIKIDEVGSNGGSSGFAVMILFSGALALVFGVIMYFYNISANNQVKDLENRKTEIVSQLSTPENLKIEEMVNGASNSIDKVKLIKSGTEYTIPKFVDDFSLVVMKSVKLANMTVDADGGIKIDGTAPDQLTLAKFLQSLKDAKFLKEMKLISLTKASNPNPEVTFSISLVMDKENVLSETSTEKVTDTTTTTDSAFLGETSTTAPSTDVASEVIQ